MTKKKYVTSFLSTIDKTHRATLSKNFLEFSTINSSIKYTHIYDEHTVKSCHLGQMKARLNILSEEHLEDVLKIYFDEKTIMKQYNKKIKKG